MGRDGTHWLSYLGWYPESGGGHHTCRGCKLTSYDIIMHLAWGLTIDPTRHLDPTSKAFLFETSRVNLANVWLADWCAEHFHSNASKHLQPLMLYRLMWIRTVERVPGWSYAAFYRMSRCQFLKERVHLSLSVYHTHIIDMVQWNNALIEYSVVCNPDQ